MEADANKRNKNDFALWFTKSKFEDQALKWDSPWGVGYPGWHIECSGISMKHLGEDLDIHCGGIDNAFPHHTNEIAQSEAYLGHKWCNWWMHVLHLNDKEGKMSKSKGEFLTVSLLEEKGYAPLAYRLFCLQSHYRKSLVFTWENLDNAQLAYQKLIARIADDVDMVIVEGFRAAAEGAVEGSRVGNNRDLKLSAEERLALITDNEDFAAQVRAEGKPVFGLEDFEAVARYFCKLAGIEADIRP